jgi:hypothetical protein
MSCRSPAPPLNEQRRREHCIIGLDIHRAFAEAVAWDDGKLKRLGRVDIGRATEAWQTGPTDAAAPGGELHPARPTRRPESERDGTIISNVRFGHAQPLESARQFAPLLEGGWRCGCRIAFNRGTRPNWGAERIWSFRQPATDQPQV